MKILALLAALLLPLAASAENVCKTFPVEQWTAPQRSHLFPAIVNLTVTAQDPLPELHMRDRGKTACVKDPTFDPETLWDEAVILPWIDAMWEQHLADDLAERNRIDTRRALVQAALDDWANCGAGCQKAVLREVLRYLKRRDM